MRDFLKKILFLFPQPVRAGIVLVREWYWQTKMTNWEKREYSNLPVVTPRSQKIKNVLVYHVSGLAFAGTEKCLQLIAGALAEEYKVFFMYGDKTVADERKQAMHPDITFIPFWEA